MLPDLPICKQKKSADKALIHRNWGTSPETVILW